MTALPLRSLRTGAIALATLLAACSTDPTSAELTPIAEAIVNADVASVATDVTSQKVELMRGPGGMHGFGFRADPGSFECSQAAREGLTATRACVFKDAAGNTQAAYDATTTASATLTSEIKGSTSRGHFSATIDRRASFTATGLAGNETQITWNGTSSGTSSRVREKDNAADDDSKSRRYDITHGATWTNVVIPVPRAWPLSGTVRHSMTVKFTGGANDGKTTTREVVITFNGTATPTATLNGEAYELDLSSRGRPKRKP